MKYDILIYHISTMIVLVTECPNVDPEEGMKLFKKLFCKYNFMTCLIIIQRFIFILNNRFV